MRVNWNKNTFTVLPTIIIVPKKYARKKRTYVCVAWLYWWIDLVEQGVKLEFNGGTSMDFLTNLDSETLKAELLAFLELGDDEFDISSMGEFEEQFVEFIKDDLSYAD